MQPARAALAARQRDVQRLGAQLRLQLAGGECVAPCLQQSFDPLLGLVDGRAASLLLIDAQCRQALHQLGQLPGLAQEARLGVFQFGRCGRSIERRLRSLYQFVQIVHRGGRNKNGRPLRDGHRMLASHRTSPARTRGASNIS